MRIVVCTQDNLTFEQVQKTLANVDCTLILHQAEKGSDPTDLPPDVDITICDWDRGGSKDLITAFMAQGIPVIALKEKQSDCEDCPPVLQIVDKPVVEKEAVRLLQTVTGLLQIHEIMKASRFQRQLLDSIPDIVMVIDSHYHVVRINRAMLLHLSSPTENINSRAFRAVLGKKCHQLMFGRSKPCHTYGDRCPLTEIQSASTLAESIIRCNDRHFQLTMTPLLEMDETPMYFVEIIRDITAQQKAADALETRYSFEQVIARACADMIQDSAVVSPMDGISAAMDRMAEFIRADRWYLIEWNQKRSSWDVLFKQKSDFETNNPSPFDPVRLAEWPMFRQQVISESAVLHIPGIQGHPIKDQPLFLRKNGINAAILIPLLRGTDVIRVLGFETLQAAFDWPPDILVMFRMFGEVLNNAVDRNRNAIELHREEARYRRLTDNLPDLVWRIGMDGRIDYVNPAIQTLLGYSREAVIGSPVERYMPESYLQRILNLTSRIDTGDPFKKYVHMPVELLHQNGKLIPCEMGMTFDRSDAGRPIAYEGIIRDLSEFQQTEREKAELQRRFFQTQRLEAVGSMASGLAHEINNPIGIIIGFSEFLIDSGDMKNDHVENIRLIHQEAIRIKELTQRLLDFARSGEFEMKKIDVIKPVSDCIKLIQHALRRRNIQLQTYIAPDVTEITGNANALKQVIMNLLINAMEAIPKDIRGIVEIRISRTDKPSILIELSDNGVGIPEDIRGRIFDPFFTRKDHGSGLGLSISAAIVESHHGTLKCTSAPGKGTTFILELPVATHEPDNREETANE